MVTPLLREITGFGSENTSRYTILVVCQKYDDNGKLYQYSAEESSVNTKVNGNFKAAEIKTIGDITYIITADGYRYKADY